MTAADCGGLLVHGVVQALRVLHLATKDGSGRPATCRRHRKPR